MVADEISLIVDELLQDAAGKVFLSTSRYKYLANRLKRVLTRAVWLIAEHIKRSAFEPVGYELGFGDGEKLPPIILELPSGEKMVLSGRIDRLDCLDTEEGKYFRIVDYKSGSRNFKLEDVYYGSASAHNLSGCSGRKPETDIRKAWCFLPGYYTSNWMIRLFRGAEKQQKRNEEAIMKELKMKGLLLADVKLIKEMDTGIDGDFPYNTCQDKQRRRSGKIFPATAEQFEIIWAM